MRKHDDVLISEILKGNTKNIRFLFDKYAPEVRNLIAAKIGDKKDQEEILQDTFISALHSLPMFEARSSFTSWLLGIARHEIADFYRKRKLKTVLFSHLPFLENLVDQALGPEEKAVEADLKRKVREVLLGLREGYQIILRLKYIEGLTVANIAQKLNLSLKATESRLTRARLAFREAWLNDNSNLKPQNSVDREES